MSRIKQISPIKLIRHLGYNLWKTAIAESNTDRRLYQRMKNPEIGDLVLEIHTIYQHDQDDSTVGWLMDIEDGEGDDIGKNTYYVQTLGAKPIIGHMWEHGVCIAIPTGILGGTDWYKEDFKGRVLKDFPMYYNEDGTLWTPERREVERREDWPYGG